MLRFFAGVAASFLLLTGAFLIWQSRAANRTQLPAAPPARTSLVGQDAPLEAPEATPKSREERRFSRADKNKNGRIEAEELLTPRRAAFRKLDANGNGTLTFEEWAVTTTDKIKGADADHNGWLSPAEYATTAPPPPKKKRCAC